MTVFGSKQILNKIPRFAAVITAADDGVAAVIGGTGAAGC